MPGSSPKVDLNELVQRPGHQVELQVKSRESPEELVSRLRGQEADARLDRIKALIGYVAALLGSAVVGGVCLWVAARSQSSADDKKWATPILASIITLWSGYAAGKSQASK